MITRLKLLLLLLLALPLMGQTAYNDIIPTTPPGGVGGACNSTAIAYLMPLTGGNQLVTCDPTGHIWKVVSTSAGALPAGTTQVDAQCWGSASTFGVCQNIKLTAVDDITPTAVPTPSGGSTYQDYYVVCNFPGGVTTAGGTIYAEVFDGPATLDVTHYNQISWTVPTGATSCSVYTDERDGTPSSVGLLGTVAAPTATFRDNGVAGDSMPLYPYNTTGSFLGNIGSVSGGFGIHATPTGAQGAGISTTMSVGSISGNGYGELRQEYIQSALTSNYYATDHHVWLDPGTVLTGTLYGDKMALNFNSATIHGDQYARFNQFRAVDGASTLDGDSYAEYNSLELSGVTYSNSTKAAYGSAVNISVGTSNPTSIYGYAIKPFSSTGAAVDYMFYSPSLEGTATNPYYSWFNSRGVGRCKEDDTFDMVGQSICAVYNPQFTQYTPGLANYERIIYGQWSGNIAQIGTEAGGTGTLRGLQLLGATMTIDALTGTGAATGKTIVCADTNGKLYRSSNGLDCSDSGIGATPLVTGTSVTFTAPRTYAVCTGTCTVTVPVPAAGYEFCVMNDDNVATAITLSAIGSSARYENTARTAYGTAGTGTLVATAVVGNKVCLLGLDSTHYLTVSYVGVWTAN